MAHHKEGKVEAYFVEQVEKHGGLVRKCRWLCRRGAPDRYWTIHGKRNGFAEIKAPGEPLKPHQEREIRKLRAAGDIVYVIDTFEGVDLFVRTECMA